jgi:hypothetical protein
MTNSSNNKQDPSLSLSESDFTPHEWSKISSLCSEYVRLQSAQSEIESDMNEVKKSTEELIRSILDLNENSPFPKITSTGWRAKPGLRTTVKINSNKLIEQGVEIEVIENATETHTTHFLQIENPNKRKGKGKKVQSVSEELMNTFGS